MRLSAAASPCFWSRSMIRRRLASTGMASPIEFTGSSRRYVKRRPVYPPGPVEVQQPRGELITDPQRVVAGPDDRLDVEVRAGEHAVGAGQRERYLPVRVGEVDAAQHVDLCSGQYRAEVLDAEQEVGAVRL